MEDSALPLDATVTNQFGKEHSLVILDDYAFVGDIRDDGNRGSVNVYRRGERETWSLLQTLTDPGGLSGDQFGYSIALDGKYLIIGARSGDDLSSGTLNTGAALIYDISMPQLPPQRLALPATGTTISLGDEFGYSVDIDASANPPLAIVGAPSNDATFHDAGAVVIYQFNGTSWVWQNTIDSPTADSGQFGKALGIATSPSAPGGVEIAIGAPNENNGSGAVYFYNLIPPSGWIQNAKLAEPTGTDARYGISVALDEDFAMVGASQTNANMFNTGNGAAYVYKRSFFGWPGSSGWEHRIIGESAGSSLGLDVDLVYSNGGNVRAAVGARLDDERSANAGAAYLMDRSASGTWTSQKILPVYGETNWQFGKGVALNVTASRTLLFAGAPEGDIAQIIDVDKTCSGFTGRTSVSPQVFPGLNTIKTYCVDPGATVHFIYGTQPGSAIYLGCTTAFQNPTFISASSPNAFGEAESAINFPPIMVPVAIQAAELVGGICESIGDPIILL